MALRLRAPATSARRVRHIVFVAFPDVQVLDVTGPLEVFGRAARLLVERGLRRDLAYSVEIVGPTAGPIETSSGIAIVAKRGFPRCSQQRGYAPRRRWPWLANRGAGSCLARVAGADGSARQTTRLGVYGHVHPRRGRPPQRQTRDDPLGVV
jgi:hypothetical protein